MWKLRLVGIFGVALMVSVLGASTASARSDPTLTVVCSGGQGVVSDIRSLQGQVTANGVYNLVNPFCEICTVYP